MSAGLTKSWVVNWTADHLWDADAKIAKRSEQLENAFANHVAEVANPGGTSWKGRARDAAVDQAQEAQSVARRQIGIKDRAQEAVTTAAHEGGARKRLAVDAISAAERSGFTVIEDLTKDQVVIDGQPCKNAEESNMRALSAKTHSQIIKEKAAALWATDHNLETTLNGLAAELATHQYPGANGAQTPATVPAGTDPSAIDPKLLDLVPGLDPRAAATTAAGATPTLPDLLDAMNKADKTPVDPRLGSLTDQLTRMDPSAQARLSHVEKIPGMRIDPNSPQGKAAIDSMRRLYQTQGMTPAQVEAKIQETIKTASQDQYVVKMADPNAPSASPSEHVSRDFGEQWNKFFAETSDGGAKAADAMLQQGKELTGLAGPGAPGVGEAWKDLAVDTGKGLWEYTTATPQERLQMLSDEAQRAADNPGNYFGEKLVQGAAGAATGEIGTGARALLDLTHHLPDTTPHTPAVSDHTPMPLDHSPIGDLGGSNLPHIDMNMKDNWSEFQQSQMQQKIDQFNKAVGDQGFSQTPPGVRDPAVRQLFLDTLGLDRVPPGFHVDHTRDLQAGGLDSVDNMGLLDGSVNMSFGSQLNAGMNQFPPGTVFGGVRPPGP